MTLTSHSPRRILRLPALAAAVFASAFALTACAEGDPKPAAGTAAAADPTPGPTREAQAAAPRLVVSYDGGVQVLDAQTGTLEADLPMEGFSRLNPAGDGRHVLVSTAGGFQVLDAGAWSEVHGSHVHHYTAEPALTDLLFPAGKPGHAISHAGRTVLFDDESGAVRAFDPAGLSAGTLPATSDYQVPEAHHGLAVELGNGQMVVTSGDGDGGTGIRLLDAPSASGTREVVDGSDDCPGVHGESIAQGEAVVVGCENGLLVARDGRITKIGSPHPYGRIGNQAGSEASSVVLGDYKTDPEAELERPASFSLTDTATNELRLVDIDYSYSFRSLGRGENGEALVFGTDGKLHVYDPVSGEQTAAIDVMDAWTEPFDWQQPRPALFVQDGMAYVSDPAAQQIHAIDLTDAQVAATFDLPAEPNELTGIPG